MCIPGVIDRAHLPATFPPAEGTLSLLRWLSFCWNEWAMDNCSSGLPVLTAMGGRSHHCCSSVPKMSPREERWERAAGEQHLCPAGKGRCRMVLATPCSRGGHHFCSLLLLPTDFTTSLHRLIGQMLKLCDLIMQNIMFWNEQFILESADWKSFDFTTLLNTRLSFIVCMAFLFMTKYSCS